MNVGDYVRTKEGLITKFEREDDIFYVFDKMISTDKDINSYVNISPNIIDLIEVGDVIRYKDEYGNVLIRDVHNSVVMYDIKFKNIEVLSIVTKEQFESMEYKVGD